MVDFDHHWLNAIGLLSFLSRASRGADEDKFWTGGREKEIAWHPGPREQPRIGVHMHHLNWQCTMRQRLENSTTVWARCLLRQCAGR